MKRLQIVTYFILIITSLIITQGCERDDICAESTPTTPKAIIEFYDVANQETLKAVTDLYIIGEGQTDPLPDVNIVTTNTVSIPLRTDADSTTYTFYRDAFTNDNGTPDDTTDDFIDGNPDVVTITYAREEVYVSRACGFKTIFKNFTIDLTTDADNWILSIVNVAENQSIENENQAHINVTH